MSISASECCVTSKFYQLIYKVNCNQSVIVMYEKLFKNLENYLSYILKNSVNY